MLLISILLKIALLLSTNVVTALQITIQSDTIVGQPSLVLWMRDSSDGDGELVFDLRFVKPGDEDIGLALANIQARPSTQFGTAQVVFPIPGPCVLVAVNGPDFTRIGQSDQVNAYQVPTTSIPTSTSQPSATSSATPSSTSATSSAKPTPTLPAVHRKKNVGAIIGGTLGGVAFLGLLTALGIMFLRRRRPTTTEDDDDNTNRRRWTFHRDKMILPPVLDIRRTTPMTTEFLTSDDIEQQQHQVGILHDDIMNVIPMASPVIKMASPRRSLLRSPNRPLPLPPLPSPPPVVPLPPLPPQQQDDMVIQMEQIRNQMIELEKNPGPTQHIILDDLQKQMNWFKSQIEKKTSSS